MGKISNWDIVFGAVGTAQAELYKGLAENNVPFVDSAIKLTCNINEVYANDIAKSTYDRAFINTLCDLTGNPFPTIQPAPFEGGQCDGVLYDVLPTVERFTGDNNQVADTTFVFRGVRGRIREVTVVPDANDPNEFQVTVVGSNPDGSRLIVSQRLGDGFTAANVKSARVTRPDGLPDDCGNPDGGYPPSPERPAKFCQAIVTNPELPSGTFDIVGKEGCLPGDTNLDFPICVDFEEFTVCLDYDGVYITRKPEAPKVGEKPFNEEDFDEEEAECVPPEEVELDEEGNPIEGVEVCENDTEELKWLLVTITEFPHLGKAVFHVDPKNTDYYAGYVVWYIDTKDGQYTLPAIPIRKEKMAFRPPEDANGYRVYTTNKAKVKLKELKEKPENG